MVEKNNFRLYVMHMDWLVCLKCPVQILVAACFCQVRINTSATAHFSLQILPLPCWPQFHVWTTTTSHAASLGAPYMCECIEGYGKFKTPLSWAVLWI